MKDKDERLLADLEVRMRQLMYYCDSLLEENSRLKNEIGKKGNEIFTLNRKIEELKLDYNNLKFAKSFTLETKERDEAKRRLTKLVRDVDRCISILKG